MASATGDDFHFRDPENDASFVDVVQKSLIKVIAKRLIDSVEDVARQPVAGGQTGGGDAESAAAGGSGDGQDAVDGGEADAAEPGNGAEKETGLVNMLIAVVGDLIRDHRQELEEAVAALMNYRVDKLRDAIGKIWNRFRGTNFRWYHLVSFVAFCALLIFRKSRAGADVLQLARTAAECVYEWIVTEWKKAFINLGGWLGFCKCYGEGVGKGQSQLTEEERARQETMAMIGTTAGYALAFIIVLTPCYYLYRDFVRIPEPD
ncbi:uncharacterized protein LOC135827820 [Sycon ciliatum]|uniref:uncharacterized protein LOC135827820 n=1 Tax=Sycon ciliatum TaxID=27933 RepID=UPI0031F62903